MSNITIITSLKQLADCSFNIEQSKALCFDCETVGLGQFDKAVGIGMAWTKDDAIYIPFEIYQEGNLIRPWSDASWAKLTEWIKVELTRSTRLVAHNAAFDVKAIRNTLGIEVIDYILADTMLLHHTVVDENPPHGLKELATMYLTASANTPQDDLKASVIANGGQWSANDKEMFKGDYTLLGRYCGFDCLYTMGLYDLWIGEVEKQGLQDLWFKEVMPLLKVTYSLNTTGLKVDVDYFNKLKKSIEDNIVNIETIIFEEIADKVSDYEYKLVLSKTKITKRSELGKLLLLHGWDESESSLHLYKAAILEWFKNKNEIKRVFNLDSNVDKAYLLYDVLGFECTTITESGKRSVTKADLERLETEHGDNEVISLLAKRSKEHKMLSTYVEPLLEMHVEGRIYPNFNQTGTVSGRYSSNNPNFQNIPRDDKRIKKGITPDEGYMIVNADYSSLEPRCFAYMSGDPGLKKVYWDNLDLYAQIAIDVLGLKGVSAVESDPNFLKKVDPDARQKAKVFCLSVPYGASAYRLTEQLKMEQEEAQELLDKYLDTYPGLKDYMRKSEFMAMRQGFVTNLVGRKKRFKLVNAMYNKFHMKDITPQTVNSLWSKVPSVRNNFESSKHLYRAARNELNLAKNFRIQSLSASIVNAACIDIYNKIKDEKLDAKICLNVHDEITILASIKDSKRAAEILQSSMENNWVAKKLDIPMLAEPVITNNLSSAK